MKVLTLFFIILLSLNQSSFAQYKQKTIDEIENTLSSTLDAKGLKDSVALYTFSIKISIKMSKEKIIVNSITTNDPVAICPNS